MSGKVKNCPQCGSVMDYRLGAYECTGCEYTEEIPDKLQSPDMGTQPTRQPWEHPAQDDGGSSTPFASGPGWAPPPPSDLSQFRTGYGIEPEPSVVALYPTLPTEKRIIIWLIVLPQILGGIAVMVMMGYMSSLGQQMNITPDPEMQSLMGLVNLFVGFMIFEILIIVAVLYTVLFLDIIPLKWCCGGCTGIIIITGLIAMLFPSMSDIEAMGSGSMQAWQVLLQLFNLGLYAWLLSIIYRDLKEHGRL